MSAQPPGPAPKGQPPPTAAPTTAARLLVGATEVIAKAGLGSDSQSLLGNLCAAFATILEGAAWVWQVHGEGLRVLAEGGGGPETSPRRQERELAHAAFRHRSGRLGVDGHVAALALTTPGDTLGVLVLRLEGAGRFWPADLPILDATALATGCAWSALSQLEQRVQFESDLRQRNELVRREGQSSTAGMALLALDGHFVDANAAFCTTTGYSRSELLGRHLVEVIPAEDRADTVTMQGGPLNLVAVIGERRIQRASGSVAWATVSPSESLDDDGQPRYLRLEIPDAERGRLAEEEAKRRSDQHVAIALVGRRALGGLGIDALFRDAAGLVARGLRVELGSVLELDPDGHTLRLRAGHGFPTAQTAVESDAGAQPQAHYAFAAGGPVVVEDRTDPDSFDPAPVLVQQGAVCGISVAIASEGHPFGILGGHAKRPRRFLPEDLHFVEAVANVLAAAIERRRIEETILHQATHDGLTGLANRAMLVDRIETALSRAQRRQHLLAVFFMDLDRFKLVNDSLGHAAGDSVLRQAAERLRTTLRAEDTIARLGGDEFVALCEDLSGPEEVAVVAQRLCGALAEPFRIGDQDIYALGSIGVAVDQGHGDAESLIGDADAAMYQAKAQGRGRWTLFAPTMRTDAAARIETEAALRGALERDELRLTYQPIIDLASGAVTGGEALLHWQHPTRGLLGPEEFLPMAEETGLIVSVGRWALQQACRHAAGWPVAPDGRRREVTVHQFAGQLADEHLASTLLEVLGESGLAPSQLCLEVAESFLVVDPLAARNVLADLAAHGVRLAVDGFGTGFSSLAHLRRFPLHELKVDGSFIAALGPAPEDSAIVAAVVSLARTLGLACVAEGVETPQQLALVRELGCQRAQGGLIGPEQEAEAFQAFLAT